MKKNITFIYLLLMLGFVSQAQMKIGLPAGVGNSSSILDLSNTGSVVKGGLLMPVLTTAQRDLITTPPPGLQIYNTDPSEMQYWNGLIWVSQTTSSGTAVIDCNTALTTGVYQVGTPTSILNSVTFTAIVSKTGSWSATTNIVNGVSFSGAGIFATPGVQTIKLFTDRNISPTYFGSFVYALKMGTFSCNFNIIYGALPPCPTPSPNLDIPAICAMAVGTPQWIPCLRGGTNATSFTYSISPATGVSAPVGKVSGYAAPNITFTNVGLYNIFCKLSIDSSNCSSSPIVYNRAFNVYPAPQSPAPSNYTEIGRFGPDKFSGIGSSYASMSGSGVPITTTWSSGGKTSSVYYPLCGFNPVSSSWDNLSSPTTLTFSQPLSNLQLVTNQQEGFITITAKYGATDVTNQLIFTTYGGSGCNSILPPTTTCNSYWTDGGVGGINIGGPNFTSITVTASEASRPSSFDISLSNSFSNGCAASLFAISNTTIPAVLQYPIQEGNSINFVTTGGTPNTSGINWTISSTPAGLVTSQLTGTGTNALATMKAGATGTVKIVYQATNTGASCFPTNIKDSQTVNVMYAPANVGTTACTSWLSPDQIPIGGSHNAEYIGGFPTYINRSGNSAVSNITQSSNCGLAISSPNFGGTTASPYTFSFSEDVSNIQIITAMYVLNQYLTFKIYKNGVDISNQLVLTRLGDCISRSAVSGNRFTVVDGSYSLDNYAVNLGGVYFDRIDVINSSNYSAPFLLGICNGTHASTCITPSAFTFSNTFLGLTDPVSAGQTIDFSATGGTPNTSGVSWTLTSIPATGILSGTTTGTGYNATATLLANAKGYVIATYTSTNARGACSDISTATADTVAIIRDNIRLALSTAGQKDYDRFADNTWVLVSLTDYLAVAAAVTQSTLLGQSELIMQTNTSNRELSNTNHSFAVNSPIAAGNYVYGFSFRTSSITPTTLGEQNLWVTSVAGPGNSSAVVTVIGSPIPGIMFPPINTRYCYVLKKGTIRNTVNSYPGYYISINNLIGTPNPNIAPMLYYGPSVPSGALNGYSHVTQLMSTNFKQW